MRLEKLIAIALLAALLAACSTPGGLSRSSAADKREDAAQIHTQLGQSYLEQGDLKTALDKLTKALQFDPNYAPAHTVIAVVYERIGQNDQAEQHYRRAVELEPKKGIPNNNLGAFLCRDGKVEESIRYFRTAIADPFYATPDTAYTNAGTCELKLNQADAAEADFRKAVQTNPQNREALFQLARVLYGKHDLFHARAFIQRFDGIGEPTAESLLLGHDIEAGLGNAEGAQDYAKRLRNQFPDSEQARSLDHASNMR
ncbi:MAG TPA: type IV pilus biogenesis/stability protein PilW [Mizugakiibacter sp.]